MELNWIIRTSKKGFEFKVRNWVMFMLHHPISVANLLLVPSCGVSFPRCYLCWSLGGWLQRLAWDTMVSAHKFRVRREDWSTRETHAREWDVSTLNKLSHRFFLQRLKLSTGSQPVANWGLFCICLQSFKVTFWKCVWLAKWSLVCGI